MKYIDEFRDKKIVQTLLEKIKDISTQPVTFMEVCGGHTMSIHKFGIPNLLPKNVKLISGPGCPVCVSDHRFIDEAIAFSRLKDTIITTYGDLIRVPGSTSSLQKEKAQGADIRIVYSTLDALDIARKNLGKNIIFLGIGFETTAPASAAAIIRAQNENLTNFFIHTSHKIMPPAMSALIDEGVTLNGYLCPGHVSTITGSKIYTDIPEKFGLACVIAGFEPVDLLQAIYMLVRQVEENNPKVEIAYKRVVTYEGNTIAQQMLKDVFELRDDFWRGFGILPLSGLAIKKKYEAFDAEKNFEINVEPTKEIKGCICGEVLKGQKSPRDCKLFEKVCNPSEPVGACMVSSEGACHAFYKYSRLTQ